MINDKYPDRYYGRIHFEKYIIPTFVDISGTLLSPWDFIYKKVPERPTSAYERAIYFANPENIIYCKEALTLYKERDN
jgi:hypothetical protein